MIEEDVIEYAAAVPKKITHARYGVLFLISIITCINYLDRTSISVVATFIEKDFGLNSIEMGVVFSCFSWSYLICQLPSGWLLECLGPRILYTISLFGWSLFTALVSLANGMSSLMGFRLGMGMFEAPAFPANAKIVTTWFPSKERGLAIGVYTAAEYVGLALLTPILFWLVSCYGWRKLFIIVGGIGMVMSVVWWFFYRSPNESRSVNAIELKYIKDGGGIGDQIKESRKMKKSDIFTLLKARQLLGLYIGNFATTSVLTFFLTWFPHYLITEKHIEMLSVGMYASIPFLAAILGVLLGGYWSDWMLKQGCSISLARKLPVIVGLLMTGTMILSNYTNNIDYVITIMAIAFFGQGVGAAVSVALLTELAPLELVGLTYGILNIFGQASAIITPIIIGVIVQVTGSFVMAMSYIGIVAVVGIFSYIVIIGEPVRVQVEE